MSLRLGAVAAMVFALLPSSLLPALPPPIGVATSDSSFSAGRSMVRGQATVFEGDTVRNGEVKVSRTGDSQTTTLRAGQAASFKPEARGARQLEPDKALLEINRVQADQIASLAELSADANCLEPRTRTLTRSFASLTSA